MPLDSCEAMQGEFESPTADFYSDTFEYIKPSAPPPVPVVIDQGSPYQPEENSDYCDLDEGSEGTNYQADSYLDLDTANYYLDQITHGSSQYVKVEPSLETSDCFGQYPESATNVEDIAIQACRQDVEETCHCLGIDRGWSCLVLALTMLNFLNGIIHLLFLALSIIILRDIKMKT